jgi:hypothetical protein
VSNTPECKQRPFDVFFILGVLFFARGSFSLVILNEFCRLEFVPRISPETRRSITTASSVTRDMDNIPALNLRVLNRHNSNITSLIDKSSYCVIYTFSTASASWTKAGYEGTLFIYSQRPHAVQTKEGEQQGGLFGFCVLNRLGLENFWGELNGGDIVLDDQYIITRSLTGGARAPLSLHRLTIRNIRIMAV